MGRGLPLHRGRRVRATACAPPADPVEPEAAPLSVGQIVLPYALAVPACLIGADELVLNDHHDAVVVFIALTVLILIVLRQLVTLFENRQLNRALETTIADLRASEQELRHLAFHDPLTKLANRALLQDRVTQALLRSERTGDGVSVIILDVDDFKLVNDTLGHQAGDELLAAAAERLRACIRREDTVARVGGDEFGILVAGTEDRDRESTRLAARILEAFRVPFTLGGHQVPVTVSLGISDVGATAPSDEDTLVRNADMALYAAKRQGKARSEVFVPEMRSVVLDRLELKADLKHARDERRVRRPVPADHRAPYRPGHRARGARAVGTPRGADAPTGAVRDDRRGDRRHPPDRAVGRGGGVPAGATSSASRWGTAHR